MYRKFSTRRVSFWVVALLLGSVAQRPHSAWSQTASEAATDAASPTPHPALVLQTGHQGTILAVAVAPDGKTLATESWDGTLKIWDVASAEVKYTLPGHSLGLVVLAFAPDGRSLVSSGAPLSGEAGSDIEVWDTQTYQPPPHLTSRLARVRLSVFARWTHLSYCDLRQSWRARHAAPGLARFSQVVGLRGIDRQAGVRAGSWRGGKVGLFTSGRPTRRCDHH